MEKGVLFGAIDLGSDRVVAKLKGKIKVLFGAEGFDADGMTDVFRFDRALDLMEPMEAIETLEYWAALVCKIQESGQVTFNYTDYVAVDGSPDSERCRITVVFEDLKLEDLKFELDVSEGDPDGKNKKPVLWRALIKKPGLRRVEQMVGGEVFDDEVHEFEVASMGSRGKLKKPYVS